MRLHLFYVNYFLPDFVFLLLGKKWIWPLITPSWSKHSWGNSGHNKSVKLQVLNCSITKNELIHLYFLMILFIFLGASISRNICTDCFCLYNSSRLTYHSWNPPLPHPPPPHPLIKGRGVGPSENWVTRGIIKCFARKGG